MVKRVLFVVSFLFAWGISNAQYPFLEASDPLPEDLEALVDRLEKSHLPTHKKLRKLFFEVKRKYLVNHQLSSTYASTLKGETYDCVTGTLLYDILLKRLGFHTTIHEFNHHVLLAAHVGGGDILFDSTDPYGIIKGKREVAATIAYYKRQKKVLPNTNIYETIEADQALGLYYFNQSVRHLDIEEIAVAKAYAAMALKQYPCDRTLALSDLFSQPYPQILSTYGKCE